ncbi:MAG: CheR family methyltransferase [Methyloligellaceae bacterium]
MHPEKVIQNTSSDQEFDFRQSDFKALAQLVYDRSGIVLGDHKKNMVYGRLAKRLRELALTTFSQYLELLKNSSDESEIEHLINAITTNLTRFFREDHHFNHVRDVLVPELIKSKQPKIRMWSAACASGPEPYSLAMTVSDVLKNSSQFNFKILATDLDTKMLETARNGKYDISIHKDIPVALRNKFTTVCADDRGSFEMNESIRKLISFNRMNLMKDWPLKGGLDAIFCRNVLIYFNAEDKRRIIEQLIGKLRVGGFLYMGHAESIMNPPEMIKNVGPTTYQKVQ